MSRELRIQYPGAIYHVTSRGNRQQAIVWDDEDRGRFWLRLRDTVIRYGWEMYAAALMTNHFHLFFRTPDPNLSRGMQYLLSGYARWWNRRHQLSGHVFQSRFRGHLVENEKYFWSVSRYVHRNPSPVLVPLPGDWPWSTYPGYLDVARRLDWVAYDVLLQAWQGEFGGLDASARYRLFVEGEDACEHNPFSDAIDGWILGSQEFAERIRAQMQPAHRRRESKPHRVSIEELRAAVCQHFNVDDQTLALPRSRHPARATFAYLARRHLDISLRQLAKYLGVNRADCVPKVIDRATCAQPGSTLYCAIEQIEALLQLLPTTSVHLINEC